MFYYLGNKNKFKKEQCVNGSKPTRTVSVRSLIINLCEKVLKKTPVNARGYLRPSCWQDGLQENYSEEGRITDLACWEAANLTLPEEYYAPHTHRHQHTAMHMYVFCHCGSPSVSHFLYIQLPQLLWKGPLPKPEPSTIEETQGSDACWRAKQAVHIYTVEGQNHDWQVVDWLYNKDMWVITHQWKTHQEEHWNTLTDIVRTVHRCASTVHS